MQELNTLVGAVEGTTYPTHIIALKDAFMMAVVNVDFVKDSKKVEKIIAALTPVDPAIRVKAQLLTNAWKRLRAEAAQKAEETNEPYVAPTQSEVDAAVRIGMKVWRDKQK